MGDAVGNIGKLLRGVIIKILKYGLLKYFRMQLRHTVYTM